MFSKSRIKSLTVVLLFICAVIQTGMLWLDGSSGHNIFYYLTEMRYTDSSSTDKEESLKPSRITKGLGDGIFIRFYKESKLQQTADGIIKEAVLNPGEELVGDFLWGETLSGQCVVYEFDIAVPLSEYFSSLGMKKVWVPEGMTSFNDIVIACSLGQTEQNRVYFVNTTEESERAVMYTTEYSPRLSQVISEDEGGMTCISTALSGFSIFSDNFFVPQYSFDEYSFNSVTSEKNIDVSAADKDYMAAKTKHYFNGYSNKKYSYDPSGTYTVSDNDTVVKCYPNGITEYFNYESISEEQQSLSSAYKACLDFINKDTSAKTGYYLSDVKITGEGVVFGFDYYIDGMSVVISREVKEKCGIEYAMEAVCSSNSVRKFKKYDYVFHSNEVNNVMPAIDFLTAVNFAMSFDGRENVKIDDIRLGYYEKEDKKNMICWFVDISDERYIIDAETGNIVLD